MTRIDPDTLNRGMSRIRMLTEGSAPQRGDDTGVGNSDVLPDGFFDTLESNGRTVVTFAHGGTDTA